MYVNRLFLNKTGKKDIVKKKGLGCYLLFCANLYTFGKNSPFSMNLPHYNVFAV